MLDNFKVIRDLKPGSVFLAEDPAGVKRVIKKTPRASTIIEFSRLVHQKGGDLAEIMPEYTGGEDYLSQPFLTWQLAGDTVKTCGLEEKAFVHINPEKLGRALGQMQKLVFSAPNLEIRRADFYLGNIVQFKQALREELGADSASKVEDFLRGKKGLVDRYSRFLSNGDLHPQNIMYQDNKFMLIDWDLLQINNPAWDLAAPYVWGWRNKEWGERLLGEFKKQATIPLPDFEKILAFDVVYLASQLIKHAKLIQAPEEFLEAQKKILMAYLGSL